jgi:hypothetical protein
MKMEIYFFVTVFTYLKRKKKGKTNLNFQFGAASCAASSGGDHFQAAALDHAATLQLHTHTIIFFRLTEARNSSTNYSYIYI